MESFECRNEKDYKKNIGLRRLNIKHITKQKEYSTGSKILRKNMIYKWDIIFFNNLYKRITFLNFILFI